MLTHTPVPPQNRRPRLQDQQHVVWSWKAPEGDQDGEDRDAKGHITVPVDMGTCAVARGVSKAGGMHAGILVLGI